MIYGCSMMEIVGIVTGYAPGSYLNVCKLPGPANERNERTERLQRQFPILNLQMAIDTDVTIFHIHGLALKLRPGTALIEH